MRVTGLVLATLKTFQITYITTITRSVSLIQLARPQDDLHEGEPCQTRHSPSYCSAAATVVMLVVVAAADDTSFLPTAA